MRSLPDGVGMATARTGARGETPRHTPQVHGFCLAGIVAVLVLISGCASGPPRVTTGQAAVGSVVVKGTRSIDVDELVDGLGLTYARNHGRPYEGYLATMDRRRIEGYYARRGFFAISVQRETQRTPASVNVTFTVVEGARARLANVEISGLPADSPIRAPEVRAMIPLADGAPYDHEVWQPALPEIVAKLQDAGYAHARVLDKVIADPARGLAVIRLSIEPGPRTRFGAVTVTGVDGALADAARARLRVREGGWFSPSAIAESRTSLYEMGRFATVQIEFDRDSLAPVLPVVVELAEAKRHELRLGAGVGMNPAFYEIRARAGYSVAGWPQRLDTGRLELRPAVVRLREDTETDPRFEALASIERLDLLWPRMRGELELGFDYLAVEAYTSVGPRIRIGARTPLYKRNLLVAASWQLRTLEFRDLHAALDDALIDDLDLTGTYVLGFYDQSLIVDLRDNPIEPRLGAYGELKVEEGTPAAAGELTYLKLLPELRGYVPLGPTTVAARVRLGEILGDLPVTQRFFSGGANSQRGFPERRLAPFASREVDGVQETVAYGGGALLEMGLELRIPLGTIRGFAIGSAVFLDGADVRETRELIDPLHVHWAAGGGLRVMTPVGPFRIDLGYRLNRYGADEPLPDNRLAFHLNIGEAF